MIAPGKAPAFQFYAAEWLADENVRLMTLEQTGAYIDALAICWREGSIPACPNMLARLIGKGCTTDIATVVQRLFNVRCTDERFGVERLKHKRLEIEREKQRLRSEQAAKAGKKSADVKRADKEKPKRGKNRNGRSTSVQRPYNPSSSSSDEDGRARLSVKELGSETLDTATKSARAPEPDLRKVMNPKASLIKFPDGRLLDFEDDMLVWQTEFIRQWNQLPGVSKHLANALTFPNLRALTRNLHDPDWDWAGAFARFPVWRPRDTPPSMSWFLSDGIVNKILEGECQIRQRVTRQEQTIPDAFSFTEEELNSS